MSAISKPVTIKDIAHKAKVSIGTVDRVLHERGRVATEVAKKISRIIKESGYQPNIIARTLVSKKTYSVAILIPDAASGSYWFEAKAGVETTAETLKSYGLTVDYYLFNPNEPQTFIDQAKALSNYKHNAILLTPVFQDELKLFLTLWKTAEIPYIFFNNEIADSEPLIYVGQDNYHSGYLAGKLIHYGLNCPSTILIVHFNPTALNPMHLQKKETGFRHYFAQNNLQQFDLITIDICDEHRRNFIEKMDDVFQNNPHIKAVFVSNSKVYKVAEYFTQKRIADIKLVGYDLLPKNIHYLKQNCIHFLINQNPSGQTALALQLVADKLVFKKEVTPVKYLPADIVTKENLNYYL